MKIIKKKLNLFLLMIVVACTARVRVSAEVLPVGSVESMHFDAALGIVSQDIYFHGADEVWYTYVPEVSGYNGFHTSDASLTIYDHTGENELYSDNSYRCWMDQGETYYFYFERDMNSGVYSSVVTIEPHISLEIESGCGNKTELAKDASLQMKLANQAWVQYAVWSSSDVTVAVVDDSGMVKALEEGEVTISVSGNSITGRTFALSQKISVVNPRLSQTELTLNLGTAKKVMQDGREYNYCDNGLFYVLGVTTDARIEVKVLNQNGKQTQKVTVTLRYDGTEGTYGIYVYPDAAGKYQLEINVDERILYCDLNVLNMYFKRHSKTVADENSKKWQEADSMLTLYPKETVKLTVKGASGKIKWKSSDKQVATVDSAGNVTGKNGGYAAVSATSGGCTITYLVGVAGKEAILAVRECCAMYGKTIYSQEKRMQSGYADCSSFVWKGYKAAGMSLGSANYAPTAAALSDWCKEKGYRIFDGVADVDALLPGDLIFECGANNGRSDGIYHVDIYIGNYTSLTVERTKWLGYYSKNSEAGTDDWTQLIWGFFYEENLSDVIVARPCMGVVSGVAVKNVKGGCQELSWEPQFGVTGYEIYQSTGLNGTYKKVATVKGGDKLSWTSPKLAKGQTYYYKIRTYWKLNGVTCCGGYSGAVSAKVN